MLRPGCAQGTEGLAMTGMKTLLCMKGIIFRVKDIGFRELDCR